MKKRTVSLLLALIMTVGCLGFGMINASAAYYESTIECTKGTYIYRDLIVLKGTSGTITGQNGKLPSGMYADIDLGSSKPVLILYGTPTEYGYFPVELFYTDETGGSYDENTCKLNVYVYSPAVSLTPCSATYTVGDKVVLNLDDFSTGGEISDGSYGGSVPNGLSVKYHDTWISLEGTVTTAGVYSMSFSAFDNATMGIRIKQVTITVKDKEKTPPTVTKHPTGETVTEGESAVFIARADDADKIIWRLVSPDKVNTIECKDASKYYPKLEVYGLGTEELTLVNIPLELDGWKVEAKFEGPGGTAFSNGALLTVKKAELKQPEISEHPQGVELQQGQSTTLKVTASSPDNNTLKYQWYRNSTNSSSGGEAIPGAVNASYSPDYIEGTTWYYCSVRNTKGEDTSAATVSKCAAVKYTAKPDDTPADFKTPAPTQVPAADTNPTQAPVVEPVPEKADHTVAIVIGVVACVAILGTCATVIILKRKPNE